MDLWKKGEKKEPACQAPALLREMILLRKICFEELAAQGRAFKWDGHDCEKCNRRMHGHGFVQRYFAEAREGLLLKRFRCPECRSVATVRPEGYWRRVRSAIATIYQVLAHRLARGCWPESARRQRCGHWLSRFSRKVRMDFPLGPSIDACLELCFAKNLSFFD